MAYLEGGQCCLVSRNVNAFKRFNDLSTAIVSAVRATAVLDGEIACLGPDGKSPLYGLMRRKLPQTFCAFDVLWLNGLDLRSGPLVEPKRMLRKMARPPLLYVDHIETWGMDLF